MDVRRQFYALIVMATLTASPLLAVVCEIACAAHQTHGGPAASSHEHGHGDIAPRLPAATGAARLQAHDCDHAGLFPVLPDSVIGKFSVAVAPAALFRAPVAARAPLTAPARSGLPQPAVSISPPLRI